MRITGETVRRVAALERELFKLTTRRILPALPIGSAARRMADVTLASVGLAVRNLAVERQSADESVAVLARLETIVRDLSRVTGLPAARARILEAVDMISTTRNKLEK